MIICFVFSSQSYGEGFIISYPQCFISGMYTNTSQVTKNRTIFIKRSHTVKPKNLQWRKPEKKYCYPWKTAASEWIRNISSIFFYFRLCCHTTTSSDGGVWVIGPCVGAKYEIEDVKWGDSWVGECVCVCVEEGREMTANKEEQKEKNNTFLIIVVRLSWVS